jgi:hypothetical protein
MKYIRVTLTEIVGKDVTPRSIKMYMIPQENELDDNGIPIFSEEAVRVSKEAKAFSKKIKQNVIHLNYEICNMQIKKEPETLAEFEEAESNEYVKILEQNHFNIDVNKKADSYYKVKSAASGKSSTVNKPMLLVLVVVIIGFAYLFITNKKDTPASPATVTSAASTSETSSKDEPEQTSTTAEETMSEHSTAEPAPTNTTEHSTNELTAETVTSTHTTEFATSTFSLSDPWRTARTRTTAEPTTEPEPTGVTNSTITTAAGVIATIPASTTHTANVTRANR